MSDPYWSQTKVTSNCQQPGKNKEACSLRTAECQGFSVCSTVGTVVSPGWESRGKTRKEDPLISSRDTLTSQGAGGSPDLNLGQKWPVGPTAMVIIVGTLRRSRKTHAEPCRAAWSAGWLELELSHTMYTQPPGSISDSLSVHRIFPAKAIQEVF